MDALGKSKIQEETNDVMKECLFFLLLLFQGTLFTK